MKALSVLLLLACSGLCKAQDYDSWSAKGDSLFEIKNYHAAANAYTHAFKARGWKGLVNHRYRAGAAWAMIGVKDSAFFQLFRIARGKTIKYRECDKLAGDPQFKKLHRDKRWKELLELVKSNKEEAERYLIKPLANELAGIYDLDQKYRLQLDSIEKRFGWKSPEMSAQWEIIRETDSLNQLRVSAILDQYGWLGEKELGQVGASALFLVIQHADLAMQEKYLPMMRDAVRNGKAYGSNLALLEDRVAMRHGRKQIYGSQIGRTDEGVYYVFDIEDPLNVDKRRAEVGLGPIAEYVKLWNIHWDAEEHLRKQKN